MCITAFAWQAHPLYPFILLLNRDEYHNRPTKAVGWWEGGEIIGGRDEVAGGTWMACSRDGRVAFLTNVLELHLSPLAQSRGDLPVRFLKSNKSPRKFAEEVSEEAYQYNGFNLIVADLSLKEMVYLSNRPKGEPVLIQDVPFGIHVLTNAKLNSSWPKAQRLGKSFRELLEEYAEDEIPMHEMVEKLLKDTVKAEENRLPRICSTEWELSLSPIFVEVDTPLGIYGTRSSIGLAVTAEGEVNLYESYLDDGKWKEQTVKYQIERPKLNKLKANSHED